MPSKRNLRARLTRIEEWLTPVPAAAICEAQLDALVRELSDAELARLLELCKKRDGDGLSDEEQREYVEVHRAAAARLEARFRPRE